MGTSRCGPPPCLLPLSSGSVPGAHTAGGGAHRGRPDRPRLAGRSLALYAQVVHIILSSTASAGTYTLGHLARHSGGQGMEETLRSIVDSDANIHSRFTAAPAVALPPLPLESTSDPEAEGDDDESDGSVAVLADRGEELRVSNTLLPEEAHAMRVIVGSLRTDLHGCLAAIEARVAPGRAPFASMEDFGEALEPTMRVRDQAEHGVQALARAASTVRTAQRTIVVVFESPTAGLGSITFIVSLLDRLPHHRQRLPLALSLECYSLKSGHVLNQ